jgi:extradiol dioxygenase family protein
MQIERLAFVAFPVSDLKQAREFYTRFDRVSVVGQSLESLDFDFGGITIRAYLRRGEYRRQHSGLQFLVPDIN